MGLFQVGIFQVGVILCGNFPGGNCPGGVYPGWELSGWELFWVGIFRVGVFLVPNFKQVSSTLLECFENNILLNRIWYCKDPSKSFYKVSDVHLNFTLHEKNI